MNPAVATTLTWHARDCSAVLTDLFSPTTLYWTQQVVTATARQVATTTAAASKTKKAAYTAANIAPGAPTSLLTTADIAAGTTVTKVKLAKADKRFGCVLVTLAGNTSVASAKFTLGQTGTAARIYPSKDCTGTPAT